MALNKDRNEVAGLLLEQFQFLFVDSISEVSLYRQDLEIRSWAFTSL